MLATIGCTHREDKKVVITYTDGSKEVLVLSTKVYSDGSFSGIPFRDGCLWLHSERTLRCGVRNRVYIN